jgi:UDP-N-acetylmuramyl pentapeptide phosphotransferase/UDP-N-acetylglucosamine-1-phosphate transferase
MSNLFWAHLWPIINLVGLGFFTSLAVTGFMVHAGLGDEPNARSNHRQVTPTAGGMGLIAAFGVCSFALVFLHPFILQALPSNFAQILCLVFAMGLLGLCDDVLGLSAKFKFGIMLILCAGGVGLIGYPQGLPNGQALLPLPPIVGFLGAILWVFVVTNAVNFMDGANGLIASSLVIASVALGLVGLSQGSVLSAFLLGVLIVGFLGFLPYNFRRKAAIFCGDTGALIAGFIFAISSLAVTQVSTNGLFLYLGPMLILPLLADVFLTLASRARRRQNLLEAHRDHLYQRLIKAGLSHLQVSWLYALSALVFANVSLYAIKYNLISAPIFLIANILVVSLIYFVMSGWLRRRDAD